jgi:tetratricopeptide (TPR) repeat protein
VEARRFHLAGEYQSARQYYLLALGVDPHYHDALNDYAVLLLDQNKPQVARTYLETLTQVFPRSYRGYLNLGDCLVMMRQFADAEKYYAKAMTLSPDNPKIPVARGRAAEVRQDFIAAARLYGEALAMGSREPDVLVRLASLDLRRGDRPAALKRLAEALRLGFRDTASLGEEPLFAKLQSDPEFRRLLSAAGLAVPEFKP